MSDKFADCREALKELCTRIIDILDDFKAKGIVSEEEYQKHTKEKKEFLNNIMKLPK